MPKPLAVITGASHGIGRAVAERFAAEGHPLLLIARHPEPLDGLPMARIRQASVDVADYEALESAIRAAEAIHDPTECLVNNAGFMRIGTLEGRKVADMSYEIDVLFKGVLKGIHAVLAGMKARGSGRSSMSDRSAIGRRGPMDNSIMPAKPPCDRCKRGESANNVRVINVSPGFVKTNIHAGMGISFAEYCERLGNPEFITAAELAEIIFFCWKQPQRICVRDIVVMPTTSNFG